MTLGKWKDNLTQKCHTSKCWNNIETREIIFFIFEFYMDLELYKLKMPIIGVDKNSFAFLIWSIIIVLKLWFEKEFDINK